MNLINNKALHSLILSPISFEHPLYFASNLPGIAMASYLIETRFGSLRFLLLYLSNAALSALSTIIWHRHIGFREVRRRGRSANHNGNAGVFLTCAFAFSQTSYYLV